LARRFKQRENVSCCSVVLSVKDKNESKCKKICSKDTKRFVRKSIGEFGKKIQDFDM